MLGGEKASTIFFSKSQAIPFVSTHYPMTESGLVVSLEIEKPISVIRGWVF